MTVDTPAFDENLDGHAAVEIKSVCHAVTSGVDEKGQCDATECGFAPIDSLEIRPRKEFADVNIPMCLSCWPEHITPNNHHLHRR